MPDLLPLTVITRSPLGVDTVKHGTGINWTQWPGTRGETLVSVTGCDPVSCECDFCYAAAASSGPRLCNHPKYEGVAVGGKFTGRVNLAPAVLLDAVRWQKLRTIFNNSMGDTFHKKVPARFIAHTFAVFAGTPRHTWINFTKRHARLRSVLTYPRFRDLVLNEYRHLFGPNAPLFDWPLPNVVIGVSAGNQQYADLRMPYLMDCADDAACLAVSAEPLLGPVDLSPWLGAARFPGQLWVIAGGESGLQRRPINLDDARRIRDACTAAGTAFWFKQVGGRTPNAGGRLLDGVMHDGLPAMAYREIPDGPILKLACR